MLGPIFSRELVTVPRRTGHYGGRAAVVGLLGILGITTWQATIGFTRDATLGETAAFGLLLSAFGGGALIGAVVSGSVPRLPRLGTIFMVIAISLGIGLALIGLAPNLPVALAIIGRSPVARQLEFARERGWEHLKFYQTVGDDFARDYRGLAEDGSEWAMCAVWRREGDKVRLFWAAEGGPETADPGYDPHLAPDPTPLWNILDWTPGGRGTDWYPKLEYGS